MEDSKLLTMPHSRSRLRFFSWLKFSSQQPVDLLSVLKIWLAVTIIGFVAGPIIFLLFNLVATGHPQVNSASILQKLIVSAGFGALMSCSFFLTCGIPQMYLAARLKTLPKWIARPLQISMAFAGGLLGFALPWYLAPKFFGIQTISPASVRLVLIFDGLLSVIVALLITAFARLHSEVRTNERLLYESKLHEKMLAERTANAQLRALQSQINPHFFFNTLNTIAALANRNSADAKQLILNLAAMYRHTLRCTHTTLITLEDDLEFVRSYLTIERARFGDRLNFSLEVPNSVDGLMLPGLVLQPIVENAIKHGIGRNVGGGDISIEVKREEQEFSITVCNKTETRPDLRAEKVFVEGHALKNVRDRLEGIYGSAHKFSIEYKEDHVCVSVSQPIVHA